MTEVRRPSSGSSSFPSSFTNNENDKKPNSTSHQAQTLAFAVAAALNEAPMSVEPTLVPSQLPSGVVPSGLPLGLPSGLHSRVASAPQAGSEMPTTALMQRQQLQQQQQQQQQHLQQKQIQQVQQQRHAVAAATTTAATTTAATTTAAPAAPLKEEDSAARRLQRSRERNREHARRTRLRKKAHLQDLQTQFRGLQKVKASLQEQVHARQIASILVGLSQNRVADGIDQPILSSVVTGKSNDATSRKRGTGTTFTVTVGGTGIRIGSQSHMNWKTGVYRDENGGPQQLSKEQLEILRRERNRRHAKQTRDRKKCFLASVQHQIDVLQREIADLRSKLPPVVSPALAATSAPSSVHGFQLDDA